MMKKILRTILRAIPVVLVLVFCLSVTAMAYSGSESVTLKTTQNEATSGSLSCHHAKVSATNSASSQHNVSAALQLSSGSGWSNYGTFTLAPAASGNTGAWGHSDYVYLCRAKLCRHFSGRGAAISTRRRDQRLHRCNGRIRRSGGLGCYRVNMPKLANCIWRSRLA